MRRESVEGQLEAKLAGGKRGKHNEQEVDWVIDAWTAALQLGQPWVPSFS